MNEILDQLKENYLEMDERGKEKLKEVSEEILGIQEIMEREEKIEKEGLC